MDDKRLIDIETKLAHQELLLSELDQALAGQQAQMTKLEGLYRSLLERVRTLSEVAPAAPPADERPPHY